MASSGMADSKGRCSEYDFVEQPPEEYFCPVSFAVLLEPYQTQCCGNHLAKESYERLQGQPCPVCREENLTAMKDKFHKRRVLSLKVRCPHKAEGCEWEGELGSLEQHLDTSSNASSVAVAACQYVDVDCASCGKCFKRHALQLHVKDCVSSMLTQEVPKLKVKVQEQSEQIKQQADLIKQQGDLTKQLGDQIKQQGDLTKQQGDQIKQQGDQIKQQGDQIKQQGDLTKQQGDQIKQQGDQIKQQGDQIKQQGDLIKQLEDRIKQQEGHDDQWGRDQIEEKFKLLMKFNKLVIPPVDIVMDEFEEYKDDNSTWFSPPFYSHLGGYKMCLKVYANGQGDVEGTHVSVFVCLMRGEFDDDLKWPFNGKITIQLKTTNPFEPQHFQSVLVFDDKCDDDAVWKPTGERNSGWGYPVFISHCDLYAGNYLKEVDSKLMFCISDITVLSM